MDYRRSLASRNCSDYRSNIAAICILHDHESENYCEVESGQCIVAFLVAFAEFIFRLMDVIYAPFYALFFVGPAANLIEIWWEREEGSLRLCEDGSDQ